MSAGGLLRVGFDVFAWAWWTFVSSRYSGGGPKHRSYADAVWRRELARQRVMLFLIGR
jgi:hypothetical protein